MWIIPSVIMYNSFNYIFALYGRNKSRLLCSTDIDAVEQIYWQWKTNATHKRYGWPADDGTLFTRPLPICITALDVSTVKFNVLEDRKCHEAWHIDSVGHHCRFHE